MTEDVQQIELLFPQGKTVTLKGKSYVIKPFGFGKFPKIMKLFQDLKDVPTTSEQTSVKDLIAFIGENAEVVVEFSVLATGEKREFFDDVPADEGVELVQAIIAVNSDFFVKRLQPKLLMGLSKLTESVGGMSSQDSSQPATALAT